MGRIHIENRLAIKTKRDWDRKFNGYLGFCNTFRLPVFPEHNQLEQQFIDFCSNKLFHEPTTKSGTLMNWIYAIRSKSLTCTEPVSVSKIDMPRLAAFMKNNDKINPPGFGTKLIDSTLLNQLLKHLSRNIYDHAVHRTALTLIHNTIRRSNEIIYPINLGSRFYQFKWNNKNLLPSKTDEFCIYYFNRSKTNQTNRVQTAVILCICNTIVGKDKEVCALCELRTLYHWRRGNISPADVIFQFRNGQRLTYDKARNMLQVLNQLSGYAPNENTLHGLRAGGGHDASLKGHSIPNIMKQAGWKNPHTVIRYKNKRTVHQVVMEMQQEQKTTRNNRLHINGNQLLKNQPYQDINWFLKKRKRKSKRRRKKKE